jgi:hypothetical protein
MRIRLRLTQLQKVLQTEPIKYPISFNGKDFTAKEIKEFQKLLQQAE